MDQQKIRDAAESGQSQTLTSRHQHLLTQLEGTAGQADHDEGFEHAVL